MKLHKRPFVVFSILTFVMFAALVAAIILFPILFVGSGILDFLKAIYFDASVLKSFIEFSPLDVGKLVTLILVGLLALLFLVFLFVAIFGIKKKPLSKTVGIIIAVFGLVISYFGGLILYNCVYSVAPILDASKAIPGAATEWTTTGFNGVVNIIQEDAVSANLVRFIVQIAFVVVALLFVAFAIVAIVYGVKYARAALIKDVDVLQKELPEPTDEPAIEEEPLDAIPEEAPVFMPEPEEETIDPQNLSTTALAAIIKDVVREIVRDELERNNIVGKSGSAPVSDSHTDNRSVVGATFGGPLIVQYFNGGIQSATPAAAPAEEPAKEEPAPVVEETPAPAPAPKKEEAPVVKEPAPVVVVEEPAPTPLPPVEAPKDEQEAKAPIVRIPFDERLLSSDKGLQEIYNEIKNEILSYGVKSRVSSSGDTFRLHRKAYVKITVAGKSLKLYFALNPDDYRESAIPVQDASEKGIYSDIPLVFKVKSPLSVRRCKQLIQDAMEKDGLEQGEVGTVNWIKELKVEMKNRKAEK